MMNKENMANLKKYFVFTYLIFWILLGLTGLMMFLKVPLYVQDILKNICAWAPTMAILILFKKLYPGIAFREYVKVNFLKKMNPLLFLISFLLQFFIFLLVISAYCLINNKSWETLSFINPLQLFPVFIITITSGPLGEELGWRGYALNVLQKQYTPLKAGLITGIIWGFWHFPLWLITGYSGLDLIYYIVAFMFGIVSTSVIITFFYNKGKNILIAMWIHFWFNFLLKLVIIDLLPLIIYTSTAYLIFVLILIITNKKALLYNNNEIEKLERICIITNKQIEGT